MASIELPKELADQIEAISRKTGKSKDRLIADLLSDYVDSEDDIALNDEPVSLSDLDKDRP